LGDPRRTVSRLCYADAPDARIAGRLVDSQRAGLVVKKAAGWTSIYSSAMPLPPCLMRNIARSAGVHVWIATDDALYTDGQYAGVHAASDGVKTLHLPDELNVIDVPSGKRLATAARAVSIPMQRAETVLLRLQKTD